MSATTSSQGFWIVEEGDYDVHPFTVRLLQMPSDQMLSVALLLPQNNGSCIAYSLRIG